MTDRCRISCSFLRVRASIPTWTNWKKEPGKAGLRVLTIPTSPLSRARKAGTGWYMQLLCYIALAVMTGEANSCRPPNKFHTSRTEQKSPTHPHCIQHKTSREVYLVSLYVGPASIQPFYHRTRGPGALTTA